MRSNPEVLAVAEDLNLSCPLRPGQDRIVTPRYALALGATPDPYQDVVQRLRLLGQDVGEVVAEVRGIFASRGRTTVTWEVGGSATPATLAQQLEALGIVPDPREPLATGMGLFQPLDCSKREVVVREVVTLEDFRVSMSIYAAAFGAPSTDDADESFASHSSVPAFRRYLAFVGGDAVAAADAVFLPSCVVMCGGGTLEHARGRGAYRALVAARWEEGRRRGTPVLVTQAGSMSRPILARLGFEAIAQVRIFLDQHVSA